MAMAFSHPGHAGRLRRCAVSLHPWTALRRGNPLLVSGCSALLLRPWQEPLPRAVALCIVPALVRAARAPPKGQGTRESSGPTSVHLPSTIYKRPDPLIYSQYFFMARGFAVTWITSTFSSPSCPRLTEQWLQSVRTSSLPNHVYRIHARICNGSFEAPVVGMPVIFSFLTFGIGIVPTLIGVTSVDLPVKGASGHPQETFLDLAHSPDGRTLLHSGRTLLGRRCRARQQHRPGEC